MQQQMMSPLMNHPVYEYIANLGRGTTTFSEVARHRTTGQIVAVKFTPRGWTAEQFKHLQREIFNQQELSLSMHPHIVEFKEVFLTPNHMAVVSEYVEGETLQVFLEKVGGRLIEGLARFLFQQLILAVDYCHRMKKVLRDIKLSTVLLSISPGQLPLLKLCDFSVSKDTVRDAAPRSQVGSALFAAPEVMQNFSNMEYNGGAADIWSCGIILAIMLFGRHPFLRPEDVVLDEQQQVMMLFQRVISNDLSFPPELLGHLTPECKDLISNLLKVDPKQRAPIAKIMQHPWFQVDLPKGATKMNLAFHKAEVKRLLAAQPHNQISQVMVHAAAGPDPSTLQQQQQQPGQQYNQPQPPLSDLPDLTALQWHQFQQIPEIYNSVQQAHGLQASGQLAPGQRASGQLAPGQQALGQWASGQQASGQQASGQQAHGLQASGQLAPGQRALGQLAPGQQPLGQWALGQLAPGQQEGGSTGGAVPFAPEIMDDTPDSFARQREVACLQRMQLDDDVGGDCDDMEPTLTMLQQLIERNSTIDDGSMRIPSEILRDAAVWDLRMPCPVISPLRGLSGVGFQRPTLSSPEDPGSNPYSNSHPNATSAVESGVTSSGMPFNLPPLPEIDSLEVWKVSAPELVSRASGSGMLMAEDSIPFLYLGDDDVPLGNISFFEESIDWSSFNQSFMGPSSEIGSFNLSTLRPPPTPKAAAPTPISVEANGRAAAAHTTEHQSSGPATSGQAASSPAMSALAASGPAMSALAASGPGTTASTASHGTGMSGNSTPSESVKRSKWGRLCIASLRGRLD